MGNVVSVSKTNYPEISLRQLAGCEAEKKKALDLDISTNQFSCFTRKSEPNILSKLDSLIHFKETTCYIYNIPNFFNWTNFIHLNTLHFQIFTVE